VVAAGDTLFGLSLRYGLDLDSIAAANGLIPESAGLQVSQELLIPWPTATPPLQAIQVELDGQLVVADPADCPRYTIQSGDTLFGIAAFYGVDMAAILQVNRLTEQSVMLPGDTLCIPTIIRGGVLTATPGPSPTPTSTPPPLGPELLYPPPGQVVEPPEGPVLLQWAAVKDLQEDEWYMVELADLTRPDSHALRAFTRANALRLPDEWRPDEAAVHLLRWRVRIVRVTGQRQDGTFVYTFGGRASVERLFTWLGALPTPTPSPSPPATPSA
jgi:LysM repeat protein